MSELKDDSTEASLNLEAGCVIAMLACWFGLHLQAEDLLSLLLLLSPRAGYYREWPAETSRSLDRWRTDRLNNNR